MSGLKHHGVHPVDGVDLRDPMAHAVDWVAVAVARGGGVPGHGRSARRIRVDRSERRWHPPLRRHRRRSAARHVITAKPLPSEPPLLSGPTQGWQGRASLPASGRLRRLFYTAAKRPSAALGPWEGHFADSGNHAIRGQIMPSAIMPSAIMAAKGGFAALRAVRRLRNRPPAIASSGRSLDTTFEPAG